MSKPVCMIIGVGPGNGVSFAKKFSSEGYQVAMCSRNLEFLDMTAREMKDAHTFRYDVLDLHTPESIITEVGEKLGPVDVLIYNAGAGQFANIDDSTVETFQSAWEVNARGLYLAAKAVLPDMRKRGSGSIVVIGATASLRGNTGTLPFASAKAAQRSLSQSLAKQLGPENIHVSYVIVDGVIGLERTKERMKDTPDDFFMDPDHIAESVYFLTRQPKSAWTFELDLRPFGEKW